MLSVSIHGEDVSVWFAMAAGSALGLKQCIFFAIVHLNNLFATRADNQAEEDFLIC